MRQVRMKRRALKWPQLKDAFQDAQRDECVWTKVGCWVTQQGQHSRPKDANSKQVFPADLSRQPP